MPEAQEQELKGFNENELFNFDPDRLDEQEEESSEGDFADYDNPFIPGEPAGTSDEEDDEDDSDDADDSDDDGDDEDDNLFGGDDEEEEEQEGITDEDLADFNKKFDKNFKSTQELKDFLNKDDDKGSKGNSEESELEQAQNVIDHITPLLDPNVTPDEDLLRKQFETIAIQQGKDINNEDVSIDIDDKIEDLRDSGKLELEAYKLRVDLEKKVLTPNQQKIDTIKAQQAQKQEAEQKASQETVQNALAEIYNNDNFYGIKPDRKKIADIYKKIKNTDQYLEELKSDKKALAELAVMREYKKEIYKKASGLTYSDGMGAILDEFKANKKKNVGATITKAQRSGTSAGAGGSAKGLVSDLLS